GISAVAAPVYAPDRGSRPIAAISVTGGTRRLDVDRIGARLCAAARAITRSLSV
ncbi:IclR family transcriptional regulator, partial [Streptomyces sp. MBT53]|nr:IclR family transcriptional regulator [Streptomyces sp. MBT53]